MPQDVMLVAVISNEMLHQVHEFKQYLYRDRCAQRCSTRLLIKTFLSNVHALVIERSRSSHSNEGSIPGNAWISRYDCHLLHPGSAA